MSKSIRIGIDLSKSVFVLYGVDESEQCCLKRTLKRTEMLSFFANIEPCRVAMESGSGAHYWARELSKFGHDAKIIDPKLVAPYRHQGRSGKNDTNDAEAVCEAMSRPAMRFVPVKDEHQQAVLVMHRIRKSLVNEQNRVANRLRGLLAEFGVVLPKGLRTLHRDWSRVRQEKSDWVPESAWAEFDALYARLGELHQQILSYDRKIKAHIKQEPRAARIAETTGVGVTTASAVVATIGNGHDFKNGRQFAAWLGLTPRQSSTGGKTTLGRITKRGDRYLRTLLVHGARSELKYVHRRQDPKSRWAYELQEEKSWNKAAVALANKHARMIWAILAKDIANH
ncbi:MAG: IS110 family transposase [Gammaproteobacteria bacterium]